MEGSDRNRFLELVFATLFATILAVKLNVFYTYGWWAVLEHLEAYLLFYGLTVVSIYAFWLLLRSGQESMGGKQLIIQLSLTTALAISSPYGIFAIATLFNDILPYRTHAGATLQVEWLPISIYIAIIVAILMLNRRRTVD